MATILVTWELGSGLGHLLPLRAIGQALTLRGHRVVAALKDSRRADETFAGTGITYVQAPVQPRPGMRPYGTIGGFAHILANIGFGDEQFLAKQYSAWNALFDDVKPALVVTDHSPTALLALRGRPIKCVNLGLAFYCPPDTFPLPFWTKGGRLPPHLQMAEDERPLAESVNRLLASHGQPKVQRLGQLFNEVDEVMIATYKEFDHFGQRMGVRYWGHWHSGGGGQPVWPSEKEPKVFAYIKPFPALDTLMNALKEAGVPTIVVAGELTESLRGRFTCKTMRFEKQPLDMQMVADQCNLAITYAGHGALASTLLAGKPTLLVPFYVEQMLNAQVVSRLGAGRIVPANDSRAMASAVKEMLVTDQCKAGARDFAAKYRGFVPGQQIPEIVERLETLLEKK